MTTKLFCKHCKDTIEPKRIYEIVSCRCGKTSVKALIGKSIAIKGDSYALVDDEGNELVPEDIKEIVAEGIDDGSPPPEDKEALDMLMTNLDHQIAALESLSSAGMYAPATNQDMLTILVWLQSTLKVVLRRLEARVLSP